MNYEWIEVFGKKYLHFGYFGNMKSYNIKIHSWQIIVSVKWKKVTWQFTILLNHENDQILTLAFKYLWDINNIGLCLLVCFKSKMNFSESCVTKAVKPFILLTNLLYDVVRSWNV